MKPYFWARLYSDPDTSKPNNEILAGNEVPWDADAISALLNKAFPGGFDWFIRTGDLYTSLGIGPNKHGTLELLVQSRAFKTHKSCIWYTYSKTPTLQVAVTAADHPAYDDKVTGRLMRDALKIHGKDECPKCSCKDLHFYRAVLRCSRCLTHVGGI